MSPSPSGADPVQSDLQQWLCAHLAEQLRIPGGRIDPAEPMTSYGLDSLTAAAVLAAVEERVGLDVDPNALWDYPTVAAFTGFLADRMASTGA